MLNLLAQVEIGKAYEVKPGQGIDAVFSNPGILISAIVSNGYMIAGVLLFVLLLFGGITVIMSAGSGDARQTAQGAKAIKGALIGFLVVFSSYWIIQIIQKITGLNIISNPVIP